MHRVKDGDFDSKSGSTDALFTVVYDELKRLARYRLRAANATTLSTTELVHEAFLKLSSGDAEWEGRAHFFGAASRAMRQVIVDFARRRQTAKRGGEPVLVSLSDADGALDIEMDQVLALELATWRGSAAITTPPRRTCAMPFVSIGRLFPPTTW